MPNEFKEVTTTGFGSRILNSIVGVIVGIALFICSFGVLYWNEGRFDYSKLAKNALVVDALDGDGPAKASSNLVAVYGVAESTEKLGDEIALDKDSIIVESDTYLALDRTVEMYGWKEEKKTKSQKNLGGSETTETTYTYKTDWINLSDAAKSKDFQHPEEHQNPEPLVNNYEKKVTAAKVGNYVVDMNSLQLPAHKTLMLNDKVVDLPQDGELTTRLAEEKYIFIGSGTYQQPLVGDVRVRYGVVKYPTKVTTFGKIDQASLVPFVDNKNHTLYRMFEGTKDEAVVTLHQEYKTALWIFRLVGFSMMFMGLLFCLGPLSTLLDIVPFLGSVGRGISGIAAFVVALVLSAVTIIISMILHNIIALIVVVGVIIAGIIWWLKKKSVSQSRITKKV
jgi:hypothetical protein